MLLPPCLSGEEEENKRREREREPNPKGLNSQLELPADSGQLRLLGHLAVALKKVTKKEKPTTLIPFLKIPHPYIKIRFGRPQNSLLSLPLPPPTARRREMVLKPFKKIHHHFSPEARREKGIFLRQRDGGEMRLSISLRPTGEV